MALFRSSVDVVACAKQCCVMKRTQPRIAVFCMSSLSYQPTRLHLECQPKGIQLQTIAEIVWVVLNETAARTMETFWVVTTIGLTRSVVRGIGENLNLPPGPTV